MQFRLLGPMALDGVAGGGVVPTGARPRVLLAALLLRANLPVSRSALVEAVWDGAPPPGAEVSLRGHVLRLRRALGPEAGLRISAHDPGYLIRLEHSELDVLEFESLCGETGRALRTADWDEASERGTRAVALWRGEPLLDVPSQVLRDEFRPRLEQLLVQVREDCIEADLRLGRHAQLTGQLRELTAAYPLRERFHAQLMLALARGGRRSEALEAYRSARRVLVDQLGVEPGAELRELHERVLVGEVELAAASGVVAALSLTGTASDAPRQLPAAAQHFIGRRTELDELTGLLDEVDVSGGTVVISAIDGMAGIGKTALAVHAAHRLAEKFPDGQLFLDLHGYTQGYAPRPAAEALEVFLRALGVPPERIPKEGEQAAALYRQRLAGTRTLIVLDNAAAEAQVRPLLPGAAGCLVLVTSRRRLKGLDDAHVVSLDLLAVGDAVALLGAVAGPDRVPEDGSLAGEVAQLCGYLPLALRIAAALLRHRPAWSLEQLAGLLREPQRRVPALSDGDRDLGTVFDLSYRSLSADLRRAFRCLGLVPGPDLDAYAAAALTGADPDVAARLLEELVDHNLLIEYAPGRYRLHDLLRAHARALAGEERDGDSALGRLLHYYAHTAQSASISIARYPRPAPEGPPPGHVPVLASAEAARAWLRTEHPNLDAAFTHAHATALHGHALALAAGLAEILRTDGPYARALDLHHAAAETAGRHGSPAARADALTDLGRMRRLTGDLAGAGDTLCQALEIHRTTGDRSGEATVLTDLGHVWRLSGDLAGAGDTLCQALEIHRTIGNRSGKAYALTELGIVRQLTGDLAGAGDFLSEALEIYRTIGNPSGEAYTLTELGTTRRLTGDLTGAGDALLLALEIYHATGHDAGEAYTLTELGTVRRLTGDLTGATDALSHALEIHRTTGNRSNEAWALNHYAAALAAGGDLPGALALYQQALAMNRELNKPDDEAISLEGIAEYHLATGDLVQGAVHLRQAAEIYQRLGMGPDARRVRERLDGLRS